MAVFDITNKLIRPSMVYNPYERGESRRVRMTEICDWLGENIGECYGSGEDGILMIGSGWEVFVLYNGKPPTRNSKEDSVVTYHVDITNEAKATLFALKWAS